MPLKNCTVCEEFMPDGTKVLRVTGSITTQADRHALNKMSDSLAPSRYKVKWNQVFIIDLCGVEIIEDLGFRALKHATNLFVMCGGRVCICTDTALTENPLWAGHVNSRVSVCTSFLDALNSLNLKKEAV